MIKNYSGWLTESQDYRHLLTQEQIDWCERHIAEDWWVNAAGEVEVEKNLLTKNDKEILQFPVQFADVKGYFSCSGAINLKSLKGAPRRIRGDFRCSGCTSLETLEGAPQKVSGGFYCGDCTSLISLEGAPLGVGGNFSCRGCKSLKSLEGAPQHVGGYFSCVDCTGLTSLKGAPQKVGGDFYCRGCKKLKTLRGITPQIGGKLECDNCPLIPQEETDLLREDKDLFLKWAQTELTIEEFRQKHRGGLKGKKFGL